MIEPNIDVIRKRPQMLVNFDKQVGREETKQLDDEEYVIRNFERFEEIKDPAQAKVIAHDFGKGGERFKEHELGRKLDLEGEELIVEDIEGPKKHIKNTYIMDKAAERFPEKLNKDPFYED